MFEALLNCTFKTMKIAHFNFHVFYKISTIQIDAICKCYVIRIKHTHTQQLSSTIALLAYKHYSGQNGYVKK